MRLNVLIMLLATVSALGEIQCNQFEVVLYSRVWQVTTFYVQDDIVVNPIHDWEVLKPEGLAYKTGRLYASGDRDPYSANGRLAVYSVAGNALTYSHYVQMPNVSPDGWGPDGLTFNHSSDPAGYGAGPDELVSVEANAPPQAGVIDLVTGTVTDKIPMAADDITYMTQSNQFAAIADANDHSTVTVYNAQLDFIRSTFGAVSDARGIACISAGLAQWITGQPVDTEAFVITVSDSSANHLLVCDAGGNQIGSVQTLPILPKARIPFGGGIYMLEPAFGQIEAVAVDESGPKLFIGDFGNAMLHALIPVRLSGDLDGSGTVDFADLSALASNWLASACADPLWCGGADVQHSGKVDLADFAAIAAQYNSEF